MVVLSNNSDQIATVRIFERDSAALDVDALFQNKAA
jgi:hypothetical protein